MNDPLEQVRQQNPAHAAYIEQLIVEVRQRPYHASFAGEVEILVRRGIVKRNDVEYAALVEEFPGEPSPDELEEINTIWGSKG